MEPGDAIWASAMLKMTWAQALRMGRDKIGEIATKPQTDGYLNPRQYGGGDD